MIWLCFFILPFHCYARSVNSGLASGQTLRSGLYANWICRCRYMPIYCRRISIRNLYASRFLFFSFTCPARYGKCRTSITDLSHLNCIWDTSAGCSSYDSSCAFYAHFDGIVPPPNWRQYPCPFAWERSITVHWGNFLCLRPNDKRKQITNLYLDADEDLMHLPMADTEVMADIKADIAIYIRQTYTFAYHL